jgi:NAD(P)-dependent dehydrogenase (short-subunit alcohol dehydrogenase family)
MPAVGDMKGKAALVSGAASGLGRATALALGRAGSDVCIVDLNPAGLEETGAMLRALGVRAHLCAADLCSSEACRTAVSEAVEAFGRLDALCNVAGVIYLTHATQMTTQEWERTLGVNLSAPFFLIQAAIPHLLESEGAVVNVSSSAAFIGEAYAVAYCASKAGLNHLTKALAMEYAHKPIRFNAVAPGGMATNISANFKPQADLDHSLIARFSGLRGMVEVDDVADLIAFLASPAASGYHGACISIDKGITAG